MIEDARAAGDTLAEIAEKYGLKLLTVPAVDRSGSDEDGQPMADLPGGRSCSPPHSTPTSASTTIRSRSTSAWSGTT